jgi:glyoxylase-like metal-dependent hydrolase (beta-lactamase superfamily II)
MTHRNRRDFCRTLIGGAAGLSLATRLPHAFSQDNSSAISATKISENFTMLSGAGANILVLMQADGVLLVNGGAAERTAELLKAISDISAGKKVQTLFNTCWHLDSTGANDTLGKAGTKIIAHENTKLWMSTTFHCQWQNRTYTPRAKEALPNSTFYTTGKMTFGKEEIQYGYLGQANTDGDIYVFFPGANILVTGDVFTVGRYPILDWSSGGWMGSYNDATMQPVGGVAEACFNLMKIGDAQTRVIPGSGPVQSKADFQAHTDMCITMAKKFRDMMRKGMSAGDMYKAAPTKEFDAKYGEPKQFIANAYPGMWNHVRELGGIV